MSHLSKRVRKPCYYKVFVTHCSPAFCSKYLSKKFFQKFFRFSQKHPFLIDKYVYSHSQKREIPIKNLPFTSFDLTFYAYLFIISLSKSIERNVFLIGRSDKVGA